MEYVAFVSAEKTLEPPLTFPYCVQDGPVRELLYHSPQTRGWVSARFPTYPQEILIKLEHASKIQQIQLLSHEYKIATKVEVFVSTAAAGQETSPTATFKRLGYISFDSNERSNHQARELKSVHVNVPATVIKLVAHRSHVNKLNIYNQIGIVALNLIGEPVAPGPDLPPGGYLQLHPPVTREVPYYNAAAADVADLNLDIHVDTVTAAKIRELARAKDAAVAREDYDEAKRIKAGIDRLKVVGQKIAQLEARKRAAVEKEDYDTAKLIKADIDKLRAAGESAAGAADIHQPGTAAAAAGGMPGSRNKDPDEIFGRVLRASNTGQTSPTAAAGSVNNKQAYLIDAHADASIVEEQSFSHPAVTDDPSVSGDYYGGAGGGRGSYPGGAGTLATSYDERPALGKGRYTPTGAGPENAPGLDGMAPPAAAASDYVCDIPAPDGWPRDLPGPEPLSSKDSKEADSVVEVAGEYVARALFSKNWQLREAALNYISSQVLNSASLADNRDAFKTLSKTALRCMKDKVANVFLASLGLFQSLVGSSTGHAVQVASDNCLPMLLDKLGDNNPKLSSAAKDCIMFLSGVKDADLRASANLFIKPVKNQSAWRPVLGILTILQVTQLRTRVHGTLSLASSPSYR
ncbi:hypothetical protein CEUSTIGMA_g10691.t1 [Chlamydomonas eustigma]|uniref:Centrosomal protein CEP104 N-terminal domain-containing protein n=1 Tax=Chlamydomonas eustigma TaxID=1157962 RepID=A0A250XJK1_9CHLO|nr:hypothetical protein CEUSTIGMA_g10691.t1 [Chlamydomonas eustigma]|eukprot:GAX83265.1 hypothetical protein CEUSTIGMA_g10691.t1 [Chlamydomonas eustigma]